MNISIKRRIVNAGNIEKIIKKMEDEHTGNLVKIYGSTMSAAAAAANRLWVAPIELQTKQLCDRWADPKSDGSGLIFYFKRFEDEEDESC